jgi:hypothetical protein
MPKILVVDGVQFIYDCVHTDECWAYKYGGCAGNHSKCYSNAAQKAAEAGQNGLTTTVCQNAADTKESGL